MDNPYSPPSVDVAFAPRITLYSPGQIAWATFLGAPIAGCWLLALNYKRLGQATAAGAAVAVGLAGTVLLFAIAFVLPDNFPNSVMPAIYVFCTYQIVKQLQGKTFEERLAIDGQKGSGWIATGVGILCMILVMAALVAVLFVMPEEWLGEAIP